MIIGFAHPCLVVKDAVSVRDFYCAMFGFKEISVEGWSNNSNVDKAIGVFKSEVNGFMLAGQNCFLEIHEYSHVYDNNSFPKDIPANGLGIRHLAFQVDDCFTEAERFVKHGGVLFSEPVQMVKGVYAVYGRDPFGHIIELCEPVTELEHLSTLIRLSNNNQVEK